MALRLQDHHIARLDGEQAALQSWLQAALPDLATLQAQQAADQAADNLSVSNAISSLRAIGDADWPDVIARTSALMRLMLTSRCLLPKTTPPRPKPARIERLAAKARSAR